MEENLNIPVQIETVKSEDIIIFRLKEPQKVNKEIRRVIINEQTIYSVNPFYLMPNAAYIDVDKNIVSENSYFL